MPAIFSDPSFKPVFQCSLRLKWVEETHTEGKVDQSYRVRTKGTPWRPPQSFTLSSAPGCILLWSPRALSEEASVALEREVKAIIILFLYLM